MRGYFFSLEVLIAVVMILFPLLTITGQPMEIDNRNEKVYKGLELIESNNGLDVSNTNLENKLEKIIGFDVSVSSDCKDQRIVNYLVVSGVDEFRIIEVCY
ncbi:MAG: hypothetical protein KAT28_01305 [Candidatus Aenigmarchaeota archaeon]|nr:hypothetical protein [Candidatus Aenigmarchaeota archaeon]